MFNVESAPNELIWILQNQNRIFRSGLMFQVNIQFQIQLSHFQIIILPFYHMYL